MGYSVCAHTKNVNRHEEEKRGVFLMVEQKPYSNTTTAKIKDKKNNTQK